jgi:hypothetical protein
MIRSDGFFRAKELEAYEAMGSLDQHGETVRLILAEVSLLAEKYRYVRRHDVPHVRELATLISSGRRSKWIRSPCRKETRSTRSAPFRKIERAAEFATDRLRSHVRLIAVGADRDIRSGMVKTSN